MTTSQQEAYLIVDIGTGNVRVALVETGGTLLDMQRDNLLYQEDGEQHEAWSFDPEVVWEQVVTLSKKILNNNREVRVRAITASSQREGIILLDKEGKALIGLPNHDHRGRPWENEIDRKDHIYQLVGRYPTALFSALKLRGIKEQQPELYRRTEKILSISDWAQYMFSGVMGYEHSQASETLLYDIEAMEWSDELCEVFGISPDLLPDLHHSGTVLGNILPEKAEELELPLDIPIVVGGADTQLAIKSTQPEPGDIVIVSGTTTPIVKIIETYQVDSLQRTWTGRHIDKGAFVLEANAGVTGLNFQRLKEIFYPNESYEVMEKELHAVQGDPCVASLGSLLANEAVPLTKGGFIFNAPVSGQISRAGFVKAILWDIACSIKENYEVLCEVAPYEKEHVWACGGGFQSRTLAQQIADLIGKTVRLRDNFSQASVVGGALVCIEALGGREAFSTAVSEFHPQQPDGLEAAYQAWKNLRSTLHQLNEKEI
jgi:autoinducer 2 (AI-2) kinase